ncbi:hypothetical protein BDZ45DRAFT_476350 [Acephala macrosclerotiorum]|nr:hypothetical protein BDZ45DRAFT_476350 [Acephala macrosclerotiorum]
MADHLSYWLHDGDDAPIGFGNNPRRAASPERFLEVPPLSPTQIGGIQDTPNPSMRPTATHASSSGRSVLSETSSRNSSASTAPSTAPSELGLCSIEEAGRKPWHIAFTNTNFTPIAARYHLPCEFAFMGCEVIFRPDEYESWVTHSFSHFERAGPPPKAICTFCDDDEAIFETNGDKVLNWRTRMYHVAEHFENGQTYEDLRPDFFVVEHMRENGLLSEEDFKFAMHITERPKCDGWLSGGFKVPKIRKKDQRNKKGNGERKKREQGKSYDEKWEGMALVQFESKTPELPVAEGKGSLEISFYDQRKEDRKRRRGTGEKNMKSLSTTKPETQRHTQTATIPRTATVALNVASGPGMGLTFLWLRTAVGLHEQSVAMRWVTNTFTFYLPQAVSKVVEKISLGLIFLGFVLASAVFIGTTFASATMIKPKISIAVSLVSFGFWILLWLVAGVTFEELVLVCVPLGISFWILACFLFCYGGSRRSADDEEAPT